LIASPTLLTSAHAVAESLGEGDLRLYLTEQTATNGVQANGINGAGSINAKTINELLNLGRSLVPLPVLDWSVEEAQSSTAFLCATSGTSGAQVNKNQPQFSEDNFANLEALVYRSWHV
jgi:hypothetical protein